MESRGRDSQPSSESVLSLIEFGVMCLASREEQQCNVHKWFVERVRFIHIIYVLSEMHSETVSIFPVVQTAAIGILLLLLMT